MLAPIAFVRAVAARLGRGARRLAWALSVRRACLAARGSDRIPGTPPEPRDWGSAERGEAALAGRLALAGRVVTVPGGQSIWDVPAPDPVFETARQGFGFLEDLAALDSLHARRLAQGWALDWVRRHGRGGGRSAWDPGYLAPRTIALVAHLGFLTRRLAPGDVARLTRLLDAHRRLLARSWQRQTDLRPRLEALSALLHATAVLLPADIAAVAALLERECAEGIDDSGAVASRNPEELAEILSILVWAARLLQDNGIEPADPHLDAITAIAPVIRNLRLGDGGLVRFHGGGPGRAGLLDRALAELRLPNLPRPRLPMGYARLAGTGAVAILDAAAPPMAAAPLTAHAGTLAFEASFGRHPVIINCGSGRLLGPAWAQAARTTSAHSTVSVSDRPSARIDPDGFVARALGARMTGAPGLVSVRLAEDADARWLLATHDGYAERLGLVHERRLLVDARGREIRGEDILHVTDARGRARFDRAAAATRGAGLELVARFHLHPGVVATPMPDGAQLAVADGPTIAFLAQGGRVAIEDSRYLDPEADRPVPTRQLVVRAPIIEYLAQITWAFEQRRAV